MQEQDCKYFNKYYYLKNAVDVVTDISTYLLTV